MSSSVADCDVAVVGAGPYGLSVAAHLRAAGIETHVLGRTMEFWRERMPHQMVLRSPWHASSIADPDGRLTLDRCEAACGRRLGDPIPIGDFIEYADWFQREAVPALDRRRVLRIADARNGFRLRLDDGDELRARRVVVAAGLAPFAWRPPAFDGLPEALCSHSSEHRDFAAFAGRRVLVLGAGQGGLESAALLHEAGAAVELVARAPRIHWLAPPPVRGRRAFVHRLLYPPTDVGPPGLNWIAAVPALYRSLPGPLRPPTVRRCVRPAGGHWLLARMRDVPLTTRCTAVSAAAGHDALEIRFDDGTTRSVDHLLLATGFRVDVSGYEFLSSELRNALAVRDGYPTLGRGLESNVCGLHFVGAPATRSFGPIMRFVSGTTYAARAVTARLAGRRVRATAWTAAPVLKPVR